MAEEPEGEAAVLRVAVQGGGCSGFEYALGFDRGAHGGRPRGRGRRAFASSSTPTARRTSRAPRSTSSRVSRAASRSTTRTSPPRAGAATRSRSPRAKTLPLRPATAAAPAAVTSRRVILPRSSPPRWQKTIPHLYDAGSRRPTRAMRQGRARPVREPAERPAARAPALRAAEASPVQCPPGIRNASPPRPSAASSRPEPAIMSSPVYHFSPWLTPTAS